MGELAASPLPVVFVDGDRSVDLGTVAVQPSLAPSQISARPRRRVPLDDEAAAVAREGAPGCYVQAALRRSRRGGRSRRDKKQPKPPPEKKTILKRGLAPTDLASVAPPVMSWDYEAQLRELQRQREWYLVNTAAAAAAPDPYFPLLAPELEDPLLWSRPLSRCHECEAAAAAMREPAFHRCVRDAVTVGFRSPVGPIERPARKSPPPPSPAAFLGMSVY